MRAGDLAAEIGARLVGDGGAEIRGFAGLSRAGEEDLTFLSDRRYASRVAETRARAILAPEALADEIPSDRTALLAEDFDDALERAAALLLPAAPEYVSGFRSPSAVISPDAKVDATVHVGPCCVIEAGAEVGRDSVLVAQVYVGRDARVGSECLLQPSVVVGHRCVLGDRVTVHAGAVIGSDGYGFRREADRHVKLPQRGIVVIEDDVEIGALCAIDRARFDVTRIGAGTKMDNLVHIAHNVQVGENCLVIAQVGVAGSAVIRDGAILAGQAGIDGHVEVGAGAIVAGRSGVTKNVPPGVTVAGYPAWERGKENRVRVLLRRLPELFERVGRLEEEVSGDASTENA